MDLGIGGLTYDYTLYHDDNGNLEFNENGNSYYYDYRNRLIRVEDIESNTVAEYAYDALGRRIRKTIGNKATYFFYDTTGQVIAEYEGESPELTKEYVYGNGYNEILAMFLPYNAGDPDFLDTFSDFCEAWLSESGQGNYNDSFDAVDDDVIDLKDFSYWAAHWDVPTGHETDWYYLTDALGSIRGMIGGRFNREADREFYNYDVYGKLSIANPEQSKSGNTILFAGYRFDAETGLYYTRYRTYDPEAGRWLQFDPLGSNPTGGNENPFNNRKIYSDGMNLYEYVRSDPILSIDPLGLRRYEIACSPIEEGDEWWRPLLRKLAVPHCELHDIGLAAPGDTIYHVRRAISGYLIKGSNAGIECKYAKREDIDGCVQEVKKEFAWGTYYPNCHTQTKAILQYCCLTSSWKPPIVAGRVPDVAVKVKKINDKCAD